VEHYRLPAGRAGIGTRKSKIINTILYFRSAQGNFCKAGKAAGILLAGTIRTENEVTGKLKNFERKINTKVQLILSILHRPELLILDEPFTGLDPVNQILLKDILIELRQQNTASFFLRIKWSKWKKCATTFV